MPAATYDTQAVEMRCAASTLVERRELERGAPRRDLAKVAVVFRFLIDLIATQSISTRQVSIVYSKGSCLRNQPKEIQRWIQAQFQTAKQKLLCDYL